MKRLLLLLFLVIAILLSLGCSQTARTVSFTGIVTDITVHRSHMWTAIFLTDSTKFTLIDGAQFTVSGYYILPLQKPYDFVLQPKGNHYEVVSIMECSVVIPSEIEKLKQRGYISDDAFGEQLLRGIIDNATSANLTLEYKSGEYSRGTLIINFGR